MKSNVSPELASEMAAEPSADWRAASRDSASPLDPTVNRFPEPVEEAPVDDAHEYDSLADIPTSELIAELKSRQRRLVQLKAKRDRVLAQLESLNAEIVGLGGESMQLSPLGRAAEATAPAPVRAPRSNAKNAVPLPDALAGSIEVGEVVSPSEAAERVLADGFNTTSKNFKMMVSNVMAKDPRFQRLVRGRYERVE